MGALLPLAAFAVLASAVHGGRTPSFDLPILLAVRDLAGDGLDGVSVLVSALGHGWGVVPFDVLLVLALLAARRVREGVFAGVALGGSGLLTVAAKRLFARERPALWESIAPEQGFGFPSGHASGSMTLAVVLVLLVWPTRWRWPVLVAMAVFVAAVGLSRIQLGVHYPSDVLAGWALALAWPIAVYRPVFLFRARPGAPVARAD